MKKIFLIVAVVCLLSSLSAAQTTLNIKLVAETVVENDTVTLGEIAQITGDAEKAVRVGKISLGYAPNVGMTRELTAGKIKMLIAAAGFSANEYLLVAPQVVSFRRAGQQINGEQMRQVVENAVLAQFSGRKVEARIIRLDVPEKIEVPLGKIEVRASISGIQNIFAPFSVSVEIRVNDAVFRRIPANIEIEAEGEVFVAARDLAINENIAETDVRLDKRRLVKPPINYLTDAEKLRGIRLIKNLAAGSELTTDTFVAGVVVRSGDAVRIVGQSGKLQITVSGIARTNGKIGDRISVKNSQSNAVIQATVVDEGLVKVFF